MQQIFSSSFGFSYRISAMAYDDHALMACTYNVLPCTQLTACPGTEKTLFDIIQTDFLPIIPRIIHSTFFPCTRLGLRQRIYT
jgi:hypothetical protein